jgi:hypothetical protein
MERYFHGFSDFKKLIIAKVVAMELRKSTIGAEVCD